ncbi:DUF726-domain-containing protein [Lepidopterella palustris CBS 459.81]|uniref:DUF726-domain-containing protein n=1 Tax=Lepidopterella palustris CBS 459.81 TaxID=1314670 RepID=A0A8E2EBN7_9PEZI|nr:DUF726-domain-containing protein [Lepidopterella palustris CBS 459.81]
MPDEPATSSPITKSVISEKAIRPERAASPVELDDFGLPVRKPRRRVIVEENPERDEEARGSAKAKSSLGPEDMLEKTPTPDANPLDSKKEQREVEPQTNSRIISSIELQHSDISSIPSDHTSSKQEPTACPTEHSRKISKPRNDLFNEAAKDHQPHTASEWSHQQLAPQTHQEDMPAKEEDEWQEMPAYAPFDLYNDDNKLIAREAAESDDETNEYANLGGAAKGYTRVQLDEDAQSATSMDDNTAYLFKERGTNVAYEDDDARDPLSQMQATKGLLTEGQRIAYVGLVRLTMVKMSEELDRLERTKTTKKDIDIAIEAMKMWSQKMMFRLYSHMDVDSAEQIMIEQLAEHGVEPGDLTPALMQNSRVKNPVAEDSSSGKFSMASPRPESVSGKSHSSSSINLNESAASPPPPPYQEHEGDDLPAVRTPSQLPNTRNIDIDLRWTILCDLFLVLISDSVYDARSRQLLEQAGSYLDVPWLDICRFEKRVTDALEMQEAASKENWNENEHMENRRKLARNRRLALMGLATVGGGLVIGLSAGLLAPVIGAGLAAGFTTIGVAGTSGFLAGAGGAAVITTTGVLSGGTIAVRAANRRTGSVKTFEYRPLHNNKRVNLIVTISGWMTGKVDDVRLPYSTVDPIMGDIYSVFWEPEMLQSMGDTINILATEALTQGLQQVLGSTILIALMASIQLPIVLTKLSYLIDNPWTVSQARADLAGLILADSIIDRNLGVRPITLVGFSLGSRVIISCLKELARKGAYGLVQNVYIFGTPVVAKKDDYIRCRAVVPGRFVNGYATNDWILGYLFRATSGGIMRVAGLAPVQVPGIENINVTEFVPGHMAYRAAMPRLLREVGWLVESDEFTEIEDPDPDNHDKRQRELINEIEEARKELEKKPEKKRFGFFKSKKLTEKKDWEMYDERLKEPRGKEGESSTGKDESVLFDIDAIRAEAAELSAQGIQIKQLESTLPPMKLDVTASASSNSYSTFRETKNFNDSISQGAKPSASSGDLSAVSNGYDPVIATKAQSKDYEEYDEFANEEGSISMTFDSSFERSTAALASKSPNPSPNLPSTIGPPRTSWSSSPASERPPLKLATTPPSVNLSPDYNAWVDEDDEDFGKEKEMKMTFE